ncbi:hypothetical protein FPQ18DRAFT_111133 [Pyronema domesticum]|uniref:Uncharacterized protein n=1 Tax=Pyronema omphalodes (strain CBS 100304) TaxID=1076935 RepID=U4L726_PYROM|nr:hypothetical protein FPQ18DRAFT_111133 [Pyronema domesticum]CCX13219.1 Protein of unknown function [Pyronema omphalodes CBS 100304]
MRFASITTPLLALATLTIAASPNIKTNDLTLHRHHQQNVIITPPTFTHEECHHLHGDKTMNASTSASPQRRRKVVKKTTSEETITARQIVGGIAVAVLVAVI